MRGNTPDPGTKLREKKWKQGSVAGGDTLKNIGCDACGLGILISQDCDIFQDCQLEPTIEFIYGSIKDSARPDCKYGKNPRQIDLPIKKGQETKCIRLSVLNRFLVAKEKLVDSVPSQECQLEPKLRIGNMANPESGINDGRFQSSSGK